MWNLQHGECLNGVDVYYRSLHIIAIYWKITVLLDYCQPKSHLPTIKHKYAENSIRYCLIRQLNSEVTWASTVEIKKHGFHYAIPTIQNFN